MGNRNRKNTINHYRQRRVMRQHKGSMVTISVVILLMIVAFFVESRELQEQKRILAVKTLELEEEIANEEKRTREIDQLEEYVTTDQYVEDMARDKLGMAYDDEIILKSE